MPLLSLPPELIQAILGFSDWQATLAFIATTKFITSHVLSQPDIRRLRHHFRDRLLAWEYERRADRGWPLETNLKKLPWNEYINYYGFNCRVNHLHLGAQRPEKRLARIPCYSCLRFRDLTLFSAAMRCGAQMVGQASASTRICIPCGVDTGFYYGGERLQASLGLCVRCSSVMSAKNGARMDPTTLEEPPDALPAQYVLPDDKQWKLWWWSYSHICATCACEAGYTMEQVREAEPKKDTLRARMKERYKRSMLAGLEKGQNKGRKIRANLAIQEPPDLPNLEHLKRVEDPFPNFRPVPSISGLEDQYEDSPEAVFEEEIPSSISDSSN